MAKTNCTVEFLAIAALSRFGANFFNAMATANR